MKSEADYWKRFSRLVGRIKWIRELLGNTARVVHHSTAYKFMHPRDRIAPMTRALRRASGISGNQAGIATGALDKAIGGSGTRAPRPRGSEFRMPYDAPAVKWRNDGFTVGENYPDYTSYYEHGWRQVFTARQAAYITFKLNDGEFDYMQWKGLVGKTFEAPARPFNYLTPADVQSAEETCANTLRTFFKKTGEIK